MSRAASPGPLPDPVPGPVPMSGAGELARMREVLRIRPFRRLWLVLGISSLGDWMGLLATSTFVASQVSGSAAKGLAFGGVIAVRLLPALLLGPLAGVVADRFDRRHTLVACDLARFVLFASIPTIGLLGVVPALVVGWAAMASFVIEAIGMVWSPTKEAAVPNLVPANRLETANQLSLATSFGITPVLGGLFVAALSRGFTAVFGPAGAHGLGAAGVALYFNAITFAANAMVVWFGIREISGRSAGRDGTMAAGRGVLRVLLDGWAYVSHTPLVRGLATGILVAFTSAGAVIGTALFYVRSLGGSDAMFDLLFGALFAGFGLGIAGGPVVVHDLSRRRWFGVSIALVGSALVVFALAPHVVVAVTACGGIGAGAGMALLSGTTLLGGEVGDDVRGRVFAFVQTGCRVTLFLSVFTTSVLVGVGGSHEVRLGGLAVAVSTSRVILLVTGIATAVAGAFALRHIDDRSGVPVLADLWAALRGRAVARPEPPEPGTSSPSDGRAA